MRNRFNLTLSHSIKMLLAGGLSLGFSSAVLAQEAESDAMLEEVIVTARKMSESLQETPLAITALGSMQLEDMNLRTLEDIAKVTPGLVYDTEFGRGYDRPVIRGQGNILGASGVSYFIDGVYISGAIDDYDIDDVERIEVVKGPQSALYGRNTYSGAINIITKSPGDEFSGRVKAIIASDDQYDVSASVRGPLNETMGFGLTARHYERGGPWTNLYDGKEIGEQESDSVSGVFEWNPSDKLRIRARAYYADTSDGPEASVATDTSDNNCYFDNGGLYQGRGRYYCGVIDPLPINVDWPVQTPNGGVNWDLLQTSLVIDYDFNDVWSLSSVTGYNERDGNNETDGDYSPTSFQVANFTPSGFPLVQGPPPWNYGYVGSIVDFTFATASELQDWSQEFRLNFDSGRWSGLIGAYYYDGTSDVRQARVLPPNAQQLADANFAAEFARMQAVCGPNPLCQMAIPLFDSSIDVPRDVTHASIENVALFGMVGYDINDSWRVTVEGRYADETIKEHVIIQSLGEPVIEDTTRNASFDSFNPRVTLDWQVSDTNMLYLLYAEGNKPGGFNNTFAIEAGYPVYDEETVDSIEFGSKNRFLDGQMVANFAFYYNQIDGYQMTQNIQSGVNASSATVNAGDADVKGMEAELVIRPAVAEGFTIMLNYAYNDSEFTRGVDENEGVLNDVADDGLVNCSIGDQFPGVPGCTPLFGSIVGKRIPRAARNQFFLDLDYRRPLGDTQWEWFAGINYQYESSKFAQVHNLAKTGEAELVNARLGLQSDRWMLQLWANNLLDEDSVVSIRRYAMPTGFTRNFALGPRRPTYYGLTATMRF